MKLIEIDRKRAPSMPELAETMKEINDQRADQINQMIIENIPVWKVFLLKKSKRFSKMFGVFSMIQSQVRLENDFLREKIILCTGSKENPKEIAEVIFCIKYKKLEE